MKNLLKNLLVFTLLVISFIYIINCSIYISNQVINSVDIWLRNIVPSLFPSFIIIDILLSTRIPYYISKITHIDFIYIISILSGSPSNAYMIRDSKCDKDKIMGVNLYTSPIFLYNYLSLMFSKCIVVLLIILNILCNIVLCKLIKVKRMDINVKRDRFNIFNSISKSINILINILGTIILFNILPINMIDNVYIKSLLLSVLEISSSFNNLVNIDMNLNLKLLFSIISMSTCGLCIHMQIKSIINDTCFNYKLFIMYRMIHLILLLSSFYCIFKFNIFN